jgi:hypothetical protein
MDESRAPAHQISAVKATLKAIPPHRASLATCGDSSRLEDISVFTLNSYVDNIYLYYINAYMFCQAF